MELQSLIYLFVGISFTIYFGLALWTKSSSTKDFYIAKSSFSPITNGISIAVDFISAVTFVALAGTISYLGFNGSAYIMGFTGGFVLLALLIVPYLRKFGKFHLCEFVEARYYSKFARNLTIFIIIIVSFIYISAQMKGIGIVFSRIFQIDKEIALVVAIFVAFLYSLLGGIRQVTYTQIAQYIIILFAFITPIIYLSLELTDGFIPQLALFSKTTFAFDTGVKIIPEGTFLLHVLDNSLEDFGFTYTKALGVLDLFTISLSLMLGVAILPHILVKFISTPSINDTRKSAFWALVFIAIIYTAISPLGVLSKINNIKHTQNVEYEAFINDEVKNQNHIVNSGKWLQIWQNIGEIKYFEKNNDGKIQINDSLSNELYINPDIQTLLNPEIANLPNWTIALILAGALAAALSTMTGLILISTNSILIFFEEKQIAHNSIKYKVLSKIFILIIISLATFFTIPYYTIIETISISFTILAATLFPTIVLGIFNKNITKEGAISGLIISLIFILTYIIYFCFINNRVSSFDDYLFGIMPTAIGVIGAIINIFITIIISRFTPKVPEEVLLLIDDLRSPSINKKESL
ncbi:cation:acetate symporter [Aliarcobacter faecis]|uniref:VC_2705 family sodium/solute symporter n=1 Tax=Aliarcobacter faecis TaxID=1564138 RepID=UPI00047E8745|nr:VC_2705 family sodium/solute symporter [Aliarcobacter faecis]QKF72846.1 cation:acetate symporter [Aliarcobacter faecis]